MSNGWRSRTIYVRFLIFALALKAMTPDANDLASPMLFKTLGLAGDWNRAAGAGDVPCPETTQDGGDSLPSDTDVPDQLPDEASLPGGRLAGLFGGAARAAPINLPLSSPAAPSGRSNSVGRASYATAPATGYPLT